MPLANRQDIYGGRDPRDLAVYSIGEAARNLHLPPGTVVAWVSGKEYPTRVGWRTSPALIEVAEPKAGLLSFRNLAELHVLSAVRRFHGVKMKAVRRAVAYLRDRFHSRHPLIQRQMLTDGKDLFIEGYGQVVNISDNGQMELKVALDEYLRRIEWDQAGTPIRLFPLVDDGPAGAARLISIDPRVQFGKPCLAGTRIPTSIIAERHEAGDSVEVLAEDYERSPQEIEAAIRYERSSRKRPPAA